MDYEHCVRLHDENGEHKASILKCTEETYDLVTPDGDVLYCGMPTNLMEGFLQVFRQIDPLKEPKE